MAKYRFKKMYFICENKRVVSPELQMTNAYQHRAYAATILSQKDTTVKMWDVGKQPKVFSVEGFYLVHESLFEKLLKEHTK